MAQKGISLKKKIIGGVKRLSKDIEDYFCIFMKLFIFFYADDTVILSETPSDLQHALYEFLIFVSCETWKLQLSFVRNDQLINNYLNLMAKL